MFWIGAGICAFGLDKVLLPLMKASGSHVSVRSKGVTVIKVIKTG
jgi:hypothetical protein